MEDGRGDDPREKGNGGFRGFVKTEAWVLAGISAVSGLILLFLYIADEVGEGTTDEFDKAFLSIFRVPGDPTDLIGPPWLEEMARDITSLGSFGCLVLIVAGIVIYLLLVRMRVAALLILVSVLGGAAISTGLKTVFDRPRPEFMSIEVLTASFPSGHAMLAAATFLTLGGLLARLSPTRALKIYAVSVAGVLTGLVGFTRLYLGVHYPTDVLAGWCLGAAWALLCDVIAMRLQRYRAA